MHIEVWKGIFVPFLGTSLGAACVFFMRDRLNVVLQRSLTGFAGGVMVAASVWSLLIPAMNQSEHMGPFAFIPAVVGFWLGVGFLLLLDHVIPLLQSGSASSKSPSRSLGSNTMLVLAVTLHNLPEGMAVGVIYAGLLSGQVGITMAGAMALSMGIAIQNFPEGAIISMPLRSQGKGVLKSFVYGVGSGVIEPLGAIVTILAASLVVPVLPYFLSFAAGAMIYVVVEELVPEMLKEPRSDLPILCFTFGFTVMMSMDVALG